MVVTDSTEACSRDHQHNVTFSCAGKPQRQRIVSATARETAGKAMLGMVTEQVTQRSAPALCAAAIARGVSQRLDVVFAGYVGVVRLHDQHRLNNPVACNYCCDALKSDHTGYAFFDNLKRAFVNPIRGNRQRVGSAVLNAITSRFQRVKSTSLTSMSSSQIAVLLTSPRLTW